MQEVMLIGITAPLYAVHFHAPGWRALDSFALLLCIAGACHNHAHRPADRGFILCALPDGLCMEGCLQVRRAEHPWMISRHLLFITCLKSAGASTLYFIASQPPVQCRHEPHTASEEARVTSHGDSHARQVCW